MSKPDAKPNGDAAPSQQQDADRFDRLARALFRVDKRDVPKHEPHKRESKEETPPN